MRHARTLRVIPLILCASTAQGAYTLVAVDFAAGTPLVASANYVQAATQTNDLGVAGFGPTGFELSSGLWMSGNGISAMEVAPGFTQVTGRPADLAAPSNTDAIVGNTLQGSWLITPPFEPMQSNDADSFAISTLVARLSVPTGATIDFGSASALVTVVLVGETVPSQFITTFGGFGSLSMEAVLFQSGGLLNGQAVDTYDIYVGSILPSPSAATLAGLAGFVAVRRRR